MDELERYLRRRNRRRKFAIRIQDAGDPARSARLRFKVEFPLHAVVVVDGRRHESGLTQPSAPYLGLLVNGFLARRPPREVEFTRLHDLVDRGLADFAARMTDAGWTESSGFSDRGDEVYWFRRQHSPDDGPAAVAAIARDASVALLGTGAYLLTIEPYQGESNLIGEAAGYGSLMTMGGYVVTAPIVVMFVLMLTRGLLETVLVAGAIVTIAALYVLLQPGRDPVRSRPSLAIDGGLVKLGQAVHESAAVDLPIVGSFIEFTVLLAIALVGVWVPIVVAIVVTAAV